ncbi:MAG: cupredoxin domain-containing protein [Actinomycetota bacterium]
MTDLKERETNTDLRERAILPLLIPVAAIVLTEIVVFSMCRVLLISGKMPAVWIAMGAALAILIGASFIAARPRISSRAIGGLLGLLLVGTIGVGAYATTQQPFYERDAEASRPTIEVSAAALAFDTKNLELSTGGTVIEFDNADSQPHNIAVYDGTDATGTSLFKGAIINGGQKTSYNVPAIESGVYYFQCDVHPTMNGKAIAEEGAGGPADEGAH